MHPCPKLSLSHTHVYLFPQGVYFARDASYSADPLYSVPDGKGNQVVMACRVAVGEYCRGKHDALTPDVRDVASQSLYDTTAGLLYNDRMSNPSIFVTYHDAQAYPEVRKNTITAVSLDEPSNKVQLSHACCESLFLVLDNLSSNVEISSDRWHASKRRSSSSSNSAA